MKGTEHELRRVQKKTHFGVRKPTAEMIYFSLFLMLLVS